MSAHSSSELGARKEKREEEQLSGQKVGFFQCVKLLLYIWSQKNVTNVGKKRILCSTLADLDKLSITEDFLKPSWPTHPIPIGGNEGQPATLAHS